MSSSNDACIDCSDTGDFRDLLDQLFRRAFDLRKNIGELVSLVIGVAGSFQGSNRADHGHKRGCSAGHHERDRERLRPEALEIAKELEIEGSHKPFTR